MRTHNDLFKRYFHSSNEKLIAIIENGSLYRNETVTVANEILKDRALEFEFVKNCARSLMHERLENYFSNFNIWNDDLEIPKSVFLSDKEVLEIFEIKYNIYLNDREDFGLDMKVYQAA